MKGNLVIAGGNIKNNIIYEEFVRVAGGETARIGIVPTAANDTAAVLDKLSKIFESFGVESERVINIKIDPDKDGDNDWKLSGDDYKNFDFLDGVTGVWFGGGDQVKITRGFLKKNGPDTKLLTRIRDVLNSGGVVGGSSAGAAIMSEIMIGGGTSEGALSEPYCSDYIEYRNSPELEEIGVLLIIQGLGFFKHGIIDQHFEERRRFGRLVEALFAVNIERGFGISEDTAMLYNIEKRKMKIIGTGRVTVVDISMGRSNIKTTFLVADDTYYI